MERERGGGRADIIGVVSKGMEANEMVNLSLTDGFYMGEVGH